MKEFDSCTTNEQVVFNGLLRTARNPIESAFGRLKTRWAILTRKMDLNIDTIPIVVYSCFVLHNFCELHNSYVDESIVRNQIQRSKENEEANKNSPDPVYSCISGEGEVVRSILTNYIKDNLPDNLVE